MQRVAQHVTGALGILLLALLALLTVMTAGCVPKGYVKVDGIKPSIDAIRARHDVYIQNDPDLSDLEKRTYLRTGQILDDVLEAAREQDDEQAYLDALEDLQRHRRIPEYHREEHEDYCLQR